MKKVLRSKEMQAPTRGSSRRVRGKGRHPEGITLLITLGVLTVLMMVALTLAITARTERTASVANADMLRARMLAESAVDRVLASMETDFQGQMNPGVNFFEAPQGNPWRGRRVLASINGNDTAGIEEALAVQIAQRALTPEAQVHASVGWVPVRSTQRIQDQDRQVLIGRYSYVVLDETGKIDPGAAVSPLVGEADASAVRTGASVSEIRLAAAGVSNPDALRPTVVQAGTPGLMPANGRWFSMAHLIRALAPSQAAVDTMTQVLFPFSSDSERFWADLNDNGVWDPGEDIERLDLSAAVTVQGLYDLFVGPDKFAAADDCAWLKQLDGNPWVQSWAQKSGVTLVEARRRIAAQIAVNIIDYIDADSLPTYAHVNGDGNIHPGATDDPDSYSVAGVERVWGISEVAMKTAAEVLVTTPPPGQCIIAGDLNITPSNSWHEFVLVTPAGQITMDTLRDEPATFSYTGAATDVYIKVKAQGRTLVINGQAVELRTNIFYRITSNDMSVFLRNLNPGAKNQGQKEGHWWIEINARNANIDPDPGIPPAPPVPTGLRITPSFMAEAFYPFATNADAHFPIGTLSVTYSITVETATGTSSILDGTVNLTLDRAANADGGTLAYTAAYTAGTPVELADCFNVTMAPPQDWYRITNARIVAAILRDGAGNVIASAPLAAGGDYGLFLAQWSQSANATVSAAYYGSLTAVDALYSHVGQQSSAFTDFWTVRPETHTLTGIDEATIGTLPGQGYRSAPYCGSDVKNAPFTRLGELGRIHSYQPMRSLRLWSAAAADEVGHDAEILDLFRVSPNTTTWGRININTLRQPVLEALFAGATTVDAAAAATAVLARRQAGTTFTNIGQMFGGIAGLTGSTVSNDAAEEATVERLAELVTVRPNYFTVVICAQTIKDVDGVRYDSTGDGQLDTTAAYGQFDVGYDSSGNVAKYVDPVVAEQKILAVVHRDAFTNRLRVERFEFLNE